MDAAGKNRYELLFMDDDGESGPTPAESANLKKPQQAAPAAKVAATVPKKPVVAAKKSNAEKENKASFLNKNDGYKKTETSGGALRGNTRAHGAPTGAGAGTGAPPARTGSGFGENKLRYNNNDNNNTRSVNFRAQNTNEVRGDQRSNRRNFKENGAGNDSGNDQRPPRQYNNRERDSRGPPRKREFDRQSGSDKTGVKAIDKREGGGAHNWGSVKEEIDDIKNKTPTDAADTTLTDKEDSGNDQSTEQVPANEEEEAKEMTLDEWKSMTQQRAKPQFNLRKAGEGEDTTQWKKMVVLNKKKEGDSEEELEYDPSLYPQRVGRLKRVVDIQFKFNDDRRGGGGAGFSGRGRGAGGGRGGQRSVNFENRENRDRERDDNRERRGRFEDGARPMNNRAPRNFGDRQARNAVSHVPKVDDERQFPTLG